MVGTGRCRRSRAQSSTPELLSGARREASGPCRTTSLMTFLEAACRHGTHLPDLECEVRVLEDPLAQQDQRKGGAAGRRDVLQTPNAKGGDAELLLHHLLKNQPLQCCKRACKVKTDDALLRRLRWASTACKLHGGDGLWLPLGGAEQDACAAHGALRRHLRSPSAWWGKTATPPTRPHARRPRLAARQRPRPAPGVPAPPGCCAGSGRSPLAY